MHREPLSLEEGVAKVTDLHPLTPSRPLIPSPQPLSRRERGFYDTLLRERGLPRTYR